MFQLISKIRLMRLCGFVLPAVVVISSSVITFSSAAFASFSATKPPCTVVENRGDYLGAASRYGFVPSSEVVENPFLSMQKVPQMAEQARTLLRNELDRLGYALAMNPNIPSSELKLAQENVGVQLLRQTKAARLSITYGSLRTKGDGSVRLIYSLQDVRTGTQNQKLLEITRAETQTILSQMCRSHRCTPNEIVMNPSRFEVAVKVIAGIEIAKSLPRSCRL
jgi:hypothetical protein